MIDSVHGRWCLANGQRDCFAEIYISTSVHSIFFTDTNQFLLFIRNTKAI